MAHILCQVLKGVTLIHGGAIPETQGEQYE